MASLVVALVTTATALNTPNSHFRTTSVRRQVLKQAVAIGGLSPLLKGLPASASSKPILVLGASGGTGRECVSYLLAAGRPCIAATRTGNIDLPESPLLTVAKGDVTTPSSLSSLITPGALGGVIYAASASRQKEAKATSNAKAVDCDGVVTAAKLCIECEVPRMVLVSSGGVSKPKSAVYLFLNVAANGIMDAKINGEDSMRRLYAAKGVADKGIGYTVVRPGGLTKDAALGVSSVELNQGDNKSGRISRADVAAICVEALGSPAAFDTTFECYYAETAKELDGVMQSNAKGSKEATSVMTGSERRADNWPALFAGLSRDV